MAASCFATSTARAQAASTSSGQAASTGSGQAWPVKPVRLVHGFIAGGSVDIIARLLAAPMSELLGKQVVVEGRPGAGGTTAAGLVARAEPDGYTLFLMASGHATSPALYRSLEYDPVRDFTMITLVASNPFVVAAAANFSARTITDLVRMAKAEPGRIDFGTGGTGTGMHLAAVLLQARTGIKLNHVPYKGGNAAPVALLAGEIPLMFNTPAGVAPLAVEPGPEGQTCGSLVLQNGPAGLVPRANLTWPLPRN